MTRWRQTERRSGFHGLVTALLALLLASIGIAAEAPEEVLDEVLVTGEQPGPAMWRVHRDDHTMWILGDLSLLPAKMTWRSRQVETVIGQSGEILGRYAITADIKGGWFGALRYVPAVMRLRNNADGATLREVLPADVYARWATMYKRLHGKDPDPKTRRRPFVVADELFDQALQKAGLARKNVVWPVVQKEAKRRAVRIRQRAFVVPVQDPKVLINEFARVPREREVACLVATLDRIDNDLPNMRRRAQAWAVGDVETLLSLPWVEHGRTCFDAVLEQPNFRRLYDEQKAKVDADWPGIVEYLLRAHPTSFTVVPLEELLGADGVLERLRQRGYVIEEPPR